MVMSNLPLANPPQPAIRAGSGKREHRVGYRPPASYLLLIVYSFLLVAILFFLIRGLSYYLTPLDLRPHHSDYRRLKPAGSWGLRFGILGTLMMTGLLFYSVRKRTRLIGKRGKLKTWLNWHILCGICGPLFILLHTSFKLNGLVALSFWSMIAVALSGVFGRYLYQQIPRNIQGIRLTVQDCSEQEQAIRLNLEKRYGTPQAKRAQWARPQTHQNLSLFAMIFHDIKAPFQWSRYRRQLKKMTCLEAGEMNSLFRNARKLFIL